MNTQNNPAVIILLIVAILGFYLYNEAKGYTIRFADSPYVNREISPDTVEPEGRVSVTLRVGVLPTDRFYIIDEIIPDGWTVIDEGGLNYSSTADLSSICNQYDTSKCGDGKIHLKKVRLNRSATPVIDTSFTYIIQAPPSTGEYVFAGTYRIESMGSDENIGGEQRITVQTGGGQLPLPSTPSGAIDNLNFEDL